MTSVGRLQRGEDFARVYRAGRSWAHPLFVLRAATGEAGRTRYGFAVGKRLGKAVIRNRVKRRLREAARLTPVAPGWDLVLTARSQAVEATYHELKATLQQLLRRAGLTPAAGARLDQRGDRAMRPPEATTERS